MICVDEICSVVPAVVRMTVFVFLVQGAHSCSAGEGRNNLWLYAQIDSSFMSLFDQRLIKRSGEELTRTFAGFDEAQVVPASQPEDKSPV